MSKLLLRLSLLQALCLHLASSSCPKFKLDSSDDWKYPGGVINYTLTVSLCAGTTVPIIARFKLPSNNTAVMRIAKCDITIDKTQVTFTGSDAVIMTSSQGDGVIDEANVDLKNATATGASDIRLDCWVQLMSTPSNGLKNWVSAGVEYTNGSIWVAQLAFKAFVPWITRPVLIVTTAIQEQATDDVLQGSLVLNVTVSHDTAKTTAEASDVFVRISTPKFLTYASKEGSEELVSNTVHTLTLKIPSLSFSSKSQFNVTYQIDPTKTMADGKVHRGSLLVRANCCEKKVALKKIKAFKFYVPRAACDAALGMASGTITDAMLSASSEATAIGAAVKGRLNNLNAWIPFIHNKWQFFQINFGAMKKVGRLAVQGRGTGYNDDIDAYVKSVSFYSSLDCAQWKPVKRGGKTRVFRANKDRTRTAVIPLGEEVEGKCFRIEPKSWNTQINMRVELYGCASSAADPAGFVAMAARMFLLDTTSNFLFFCAPRVDRKPQDPSCFYTKNNGESYYAIDPIVLNIKYLDPTKKLLYGIGNNGLKLACAADAVSEWGVIADAEYTAASSASGVLQAKSADHLTTTASGAQPLAADQLALTSGQTWGATGEGLHYKASSSWALKATWY
ncbi:uncharacterized protein LOC5506122 [Nematostella vectensis]|uniref:uncharacterized protein LOC5506122 n=1 Tax=Nematostella vectensis TaxID=45351 RepID=UPI002076F75B|nr:uncharacterized protein LOC5506122 [Nematostella vectensis]